MHRFVIFILWGLHLVHSSYAAEINPNYFKGYEGGFVLLDRTTSKTTRYNPELCEIPVAPCSTFKIYNGLIGLETGIIKSVDAPFYKWDKVVRPMEDWNKDLTFADAFRVSCVPAFQELARKIGPKRMTSYLTKIKYGNADLSKGVDSFWLPEQGKSPILISANQQVELLDQLLHGKLPFSSKNSALMKDVMKVATSAKGTIYGKTGTAFSASNTPEMGWFVGFANTQEKDYIFACLLKKGENASGKTAKEISLLILRDLGIFL